MAVTSTSTVLVRNGPSDWEGLRKEARLLENELDMKLLSFSKFGTMRDKEYAKEKEPLIGPSDGHLFDTMSAEIERLLSKLTSVNDKLGEFLANLSFGEPSAAQLHTMQRHRDILQDYSHEFAKTKASIKANRERADLLGSVRRDISAYKTGLNRRTELFLKEHEHLKNSERLTDDAIGIALATKENLHSQRNFLHTITTKVGGITNRFPAINNLVQKINVRKRRDTLILGTVISICIILLLLYGLS